MIIIIIILIMIIIIIIIIIMMMIIIIIVMRTYMHPILHEPRTWRKYSCTERHQKNKLTNLRTAGKG